MLLSRQEFDATGIVRRPQAFSALSWPRCRTAFKQLAVATATSLVTATSLFVMKDALPRAVLLGLFLGTVLVAHGSLTQQSNRRAHAAFLGLCIGTVVVAAYWLRWSIRFSNPDEWDYLCFYLNGQVAARGLNFYDQGVFVDVFRELLIPYAPSRGFMNGYLHTTFPYPPPTMFLFLPLGYFDYTSANILWMGIVLGAFVLCILAAYKAFFSGYGLNSLMLLCVILLVLPMTSRVFRYEQTTFFMFLASLLFWQERDGPRAGLWAVLAVLVKPVMGVLLLYLLVRRQWRGVLVAAGAGLCIAALTLSVFGAPVFMSYLFDNPALRLSEKLYTQSINQSLIATIIRVFGHDFQAASPLANPIFLVTGGLLSLGSFAALLLLRETHRHWGIAILIPYALIIYPQTLHHYSVLLVLPLLVLYQEYRGARPRLIGMSALIATVLVVMEYSAFSANLLVWGAVLASCLSERRFGTVLVSAPGTSRG